MRETVWIVAETRDGAERCALSVRSGHFSTYAAAEAFRSDLPLPLQGRLRVFDVERTIAHDGVIVLASKIAATAAGFAMLAYSGGVLSAVGL
jgi:hypothetical protein